jgi:hypothetical protein
MDKFDGPLALAWRNEWIVVFRSSLEETYAARDIGICGVLSGNIADRPRIIQPELGLLPSARARNELTGTELKPPELDDVAL